MRALAEVDPARIGESPARAALLRLSPGSAEFHRMLENLPVGAYTCDAAGLITYYNPRAVELWGRAPKLNHPDDRFCGSFALFTTHGAPIAHADCWMALALRERREYSHEEILIRRPNGDEVVAMAHANPFVDDNGTLVGAINVLVDITNRKYAQDALQRARDDLATAVAQRTAQLTELSQYLIRVAEEERQRLAAELHDELGALHTVIGMELERVLQELEAHAPGLVERQRSAIELLHQAIDIKRRIITDLRPVMLHDFGLVPTLKEHAERWARASGIELRLHLPETFPVLSEDVELALFRIAQESLTNVVKYANATEVSIALALVGGELVLSIVDDGVGMVLETAEQRRSHGILGMRQRIAQCGGELLITPGPDGVGTAISVCLDIAPQATSDAAAHEVIALARNASPVRA